MTTTQTFTGKIIDPYDVRPEDVDVLDVAHQLAMECRWGGTVQRFMSVAEHSVRVSRACDPADAKWGLLHDASEAYLGDVRKPIKECGDFEAYRAAEARCMAAVCARFGLDPREPESVRRADHVLALTEGRDLVHHAPRPKAGAAPLSGTIVPWDWEEARDRFLARFAELFGDGALGAAVYTRRTLRASTAFLDRARLARELLGDAWTDALSARLSAMHDRYVEAALADEV